MEEKPSGAAKERMVDSWNAASTADSAAANTSEQNDEVDSYFLAVEKAVRACAKLKSRADELGVKVFLNRNLMYLRPDGSKKRQRRCSVQKQRVATNGPNAGFRFPLLIGDQLPADFSRTVGDNTLCANQLTDARMKLQFIGFYDSESQEQWMTTKADMRADLLVDLRNMRKNSTHRYIKALFDTPRPLHVNESESDWLKRTFDCVTVNFDEIFENIRLRYGPVRIDRIRLNFQVVVTEIRRARREFTAMSKQDDREQGAAPESGRSASANAHRHYPAKYAATHVLWQRRDSTARSLYSIHHASLWRSATFGDALSQAKIESDGLFSLSSRFGEYEQRLAVVRVGNRSTDCVFNEPNDQPDAATVEESSEVQLCENFTKVRGRLHETTTSENGELALLGHVATNGTQSKPNNTSKPKLDCTDLDDALAAPSYRDAYCLEFPLSKAASLSRPTPGHMRGPLVDELHQYPILRFRILPVTMGDRFVDESNSSFWLRAFNAAEQSISSSDTQSLKSKPHNPRAPSSSTAVIGVRMSDTTVTNSPDAPTNCSDASRRPKRSAALDATNFISVREDVKLDKKSSGCSTTNGSKRPRRKSDSDELENGTDVAKDVKRLRRKDLTNGYCRPSTRKLRCLAADFAGESIVSGSTTYVGSDTDEAELNDTSDNDEPSTSNGSTKQKDFKSRKSHASSSVGAADRQVMSEADRFVRYVFVDAEGAGVWRIVAVHGTQCLFCALRTRTFQALVVHLSYVHLQFHIEADLEVRCVGVRPKARGELSGLLVNDLHELGYRPVIHLPTTSDRLVHLKLANRLLLEHQPLATWHSNATSSHVQMLSQPHISVADGDQQTLQAHENGTINATVQETATCTSNHKSSTPAAQAQDEVDGIGNSAVTKCKQANMHLQVSNKSALMVANSVGLLFTRCYVAGSYKPQRRSEETYVIVRNCNRQARKRLILEALNCKAVLREPLSTVSECPTRIAYQRPGLNRVFFHTCTYLPVLPTELDNDSETEEDPSWLHTRIATQLDDLIDVNDGEKQVMTIWCSHLLKHTNEFTGDRKVVRALDSFIDEYVFALRPRRRNFVLLLSSLCDYGVINAADLRAALRRLDEATTMANAGDFTHPSSPLCDK